MGEVIYDIASGPGAGAAESSSDQHTDDLQTPDADTTDQLETADDDTAGPLPFKDHKRILETTREKIRREYEERFGWADGLDRRQVDRALNILDELDTRPERVHAWLAERLRGNGAAELPGPDLKTEDGKFLFSAEQQERREAVLLSRFKQEVDERVGAVEGRLATADTREGIKTQVEEAMTTWPYFKDHLAPINAALKRAQDLGTPITLERAWMLTVLPKFRQLERGSFVDELKSKPGEQIRPGRSPSRTATADTDRPWSELLEESIGAGR